MEFNLYYDRKSKLHYYVPSEEESIICSKCLKKISKFIYFFTNWKFDKTGEIKLFCSSCYKESKKEFGVVQETLWALIVPAIPEGSQIRFIRPPILRTGDNDLSVFEAVNLKSTETIDKTKYSQIESIEGAKIGAMPEEPKEIKNEKESLEFLRFSKNSIPYIEDQQKKSLK